MPALPYESRLQKYIALPDEVLSIIGPRRIPAIPCPTQNTNSSIAVSTSVGFRHLEVEDYIEAVEELRPDIATGIADIITADTASAKRIEKSADRSHAWLRDMLGAYDGGSTASSAIFASIPPIEKEQMLFYLNDLSEEFRAQISGLIIYDLDTVNAIPKEISHLPRLCLFEPSSPHALLHCISLGMDLITVPFITTYSEHGIAFSFTFDSSKELSDQSLGLDLWSTDHITDLSPLHPGCKCYACTRHHRAYVHHLLQAKEMLGWTLISIHNYAMMDVFFEGVRASIARNTFDEDIEAFTRTYCAAMPEKTGEGPRTRGYQTKSVGGGEPKKNPKAYGRLDDAIQKLEEAESGIATPTGDAGELEEHGFAEKTD
jgi:queuine tRNA-ribosyltransferase accessory subunit